MATINAKNIPDDLYALLKGYAQANHRSINSEIIVCIERTVRSQKLNPEEILVETRSLREKTSTYLITDSEFTQAKERGRL